MFKVTPKKCLHGKKLKNFYRLAYNTMYHFNNFRPSMWQERPSVELTEQQLHRFLTVFYSYLK